MSPPRLLATITDQVIHDDLSDFLLHLVSITGGAITATAAFFLSKSYGLPDKDIVFCWTLAGFLLGLMCTSCCMEVMAASNAALYVCFSEEPAIFRSTKPAHYECLVGAWRRRFGTLHVG